MSRSVSAPSSVTKTSPCWNGLIVPGSTFRYGSNFWQATLRPRLSSRHPMLAAAIPFPSEETTPPVTKMNLAMLNPLKNGSFEQLGYPVEVFGRIHAQGFVFGFDDANAIPIFKRAKLFETFGLLQASNRQRGII